MFVTPTNPRFIDKAWTRGGDVYILDIEDSIAPAEKERCRTLIRESIEKATKGGASIYVRINKPFVDADLPYAVWPGVDRIMLPKTESAAEMQHAHEIISRLEKERGIVPGRRSSSRPMIESALGAVNIHEILTATPRKIWSHGRGGGYDMAVNLGIEMFANFDQYAFPVAYVALAAMALGIEATGGVFVPNTSGRVDQSDQAAKQAEALHAAGIHHAGALHPAFIQPLVSGLSPTADEIAWAEQGHRGIRRCLRDAGESVGTLDGKVIDKYEYACAGTLDWAAACAAKDRYKARAMARAVQAGETEVIDGDGLTSAQRAADGLTLQALSRRRVALLAFDLDPAQATDDFVGFTRRGAVSRLSPLGRAAEPAAFRSIRPCLERPRSFRSTEAPFQKFRWIHVPTEGAAGEFRYRVTATLHGRRRSADDRRAGRERDLARAADDRRISSTSASRAASRPRRRMPTASTTKPAFCRRPGRPRPPASTMTWRRSRRTTTGSDSRRDG